MPRAGPLSGALPVTSPTSAGRTAAMTTTTDSPTSYNVSPATAPLSTSRPTTFSSSNSLSFPLSTFPLSPITTLLVSPRHTPLHIHTSILTSASPFFRAALSPGHGFQECQTNTVSLMEESVATVSAFIRWCYVWGMNGGFGNAGLWDWEKVDGPLEELREWRKECKEIKRGKRRVATEQHEQEPAEQTMVQHFVENEDENEHEGEHESTRPASSAPVSTLALVSALLTCPSSATTSLPSPPHTPLPTSPTISSSHPLILPPRPSPPTFTPLLHLYIFADKYNIPTLRDRICARCVAVAREANAVPGKEDIDLIWNNTMPTTAAGLGRRRNPMRQLILDLYRGMNTRKMVGEMLEVEQDDSTEGEGNEDAAMMATFWRELVGELMGAQKERERDQVDGNANANANDDNNSEGLAIVLGKVRRPAGFYSERNTEW